MLPFKSNARNILPKFRVLVARVAKIIDSRLKGTYIAWNYSKGYQIIQQKKISKRRRVLPTRGQSWTRKVVREEVLKNNCFFPRNKGHLPFHTDQQFTFSFGGISSPGLGGFSSWYSSSSDVYSTDTQAIVVPLGLLEVTPCLSAFLLTAPWSKSIPWLTLLVDRARHLGQNLWWKPNETPMKVIIITWYLFKMSVRVKAFRENRKPTQPN